MAVKNAANSNQVKSAKSKAKLSRERELKDILRLAESLDGEKFLRFLWRYLGLCGVFRTSFTGKDDTFFLEGQRNIGLQLLADVNEADPQIYVRMIELGRREEEQDAS